MHRSWIVTFLTAGLLWFLVGQVNHGLAPCGVYLFAGALFVLLPALRLTYWHGFAAVALTGLLLDAAEPVPFGTHLLLFAAAHSVLFTLRNRLPRDENALTVLVALAANLVLFLAFSAVALRHSPAPGHAVLRLLSDLFFSELFVALAASWFFALQRRALALVGADLAEEQRYPL